MTNTNRPTTFLAVEPWLRALANPITLAKCESEGSPYPYLFGMATVKLCEAHEEIARLRKRLDEQAGQLAQDCELDS